MDFLERSMTLAGATYTSVLGGNSLYRVLKRKTLRSQIGQLRSQIEDVKVHTDRRFDELHLALIRSK